LARTSSSLFEVPACRLINDNYNPRTEQTIDIGHGTVKTNPSFCTSARQKPEQRWEDIIEICADIMAEKSQVRQY